VVVDRMTFPSLLGGNGLATGDYVREPDRGPLGVYANPFLVPYLIREHLGFQW